MSGERFRHGLVVGKFSPLHRGHQLLIDRALAQCARVTALCYTKPVLPGCSAARRRAWLRAVYPPESFPHFQALVLTDRLWASRGGEVSVPRDSAAGVVHWRFVGKVCLELLHTTVDAVFTSEAYGDGFAEGLSRFFAHRGVATGSATASAPTVCHVAVDPPRTTVPISATAIRRDPHAHRRWLHPAVYASFVERVAVLGGESSGKSTLTQALAEAYGTVGVAEYGRELWEARHAQGLALTAQDLLCIGRRQVQREAEALLTARRYLFCDTSPLTTLLYSRHLFGRVDPRLEALATRRYAHTILCAPDFSFVQDGTRQSPEFRAQQHRWYLEELGRRGCPYLEVGGSPGERLAKVQGVLGGVGEE